MSLKVLEKCFAEAKENENLFVALALNSPDYKEPEVTIVPRSNFDDKLKYCKSVFNEELVSKHNDSYSIAGYSCGDDIEDLLHDVFDTDVFKLSTEDDEEE